MRLREAVTSTPRGGPAESPVSANAEELASDALHSPPELAQPPTTPAAEDPDDDVESLRRVVHNIKTVLEKVPETSEVCWTMFVSKQHFTGERHILLQLWPYANIAWKVMYLAHKVWTIIPVSSRTLMILRISVGRSGT